MATKRKQFAVKKGPALFEVIICRYWFFPYENTFSALRFEMEKKQVLWAHIDGIFPLTQHGTGPAEVLLFGRACNTDLIGGRSNFVMQYNKQTRAGTLVPLDELPCDNELLTTYFPNFFKKPTPIPENPVLAHLRSLPWEKKLQLAKDLTKDLLQRRVDTPRVYKFVLELFDDDHPHDQQVSIEIAQNPDFDVERLSDVFAKICPIVTDFFRELGMEYFLTSGGRMSGGKLGSVIISLGPKNEIDFD